MRHSDSYWLIHFQSEWGLLIGCFGHHSKTLIICYDWRAVLIGQFTWTEWAPLIGCLRKVLRIIKNAQIFFYLHTILVGC